MSGGIRNQDASRIMKGVMMVLQNAVESR